MSELQESSVAENLMYGLRDQRASIVRADGGSEPFIVIEDVFEHRNLETRAATKLLVHHALSGIELNLASKGENWTKFDQAKLDNLKRFEPATFSEDLEDKHFMNSILIARDQRRSTLGAARTLTVFDGGVSVLHAGFTDEEYDDEWDSYYDGNPSEATDKDIYHHPRLGFVLGNTQRLVGNKAVDAVAGILIYIEKRQKIHPGELTKSLTRVWPRSNPETLANTYSLGTVPSKDFLKAAAKAADIIANDYFLGCVK